MITIAYYSYSCLICPKHNVTYVASHFDLTKTLEGRHHYPSFEDKETDWERLFYPCHTYTIRRLKTRFLRCEVYVLSVMPHLMRYTFLKQVSSSFPTPLSLPDFPVPALIRPGSLGQPLMFSHRSCISSVPPCTSILACLFPP